MRRDVLFVHPPRYFPGPDALPQIPGPFGITVRESTPQFVIHPVGLLSMADYLDRHGYSVAIENMGESMITEPQFDADHYIAGLDATIFGIDLHWCVHAQGAIEVARKTKHLHPDSFVVLGGLTSTVFAEEIVRDYPFVDAVIRGEGEEALLQLAEGLGSRSPLDAVPNLCYVKAGAVKSNPLGEPAESLDGYEFARLDLASPRTSSASSFASLPICRGCMYDCVTCGGSKYSYERLCHRMKPAFRSPDKVAEDLWRLKDLGVRRAFLFQDPQMGGREYCEKLVLAIKKPCEEMDAVNIEFFTPPPQDYLLQLSKLKERTALTISPEAALEGPRQRHGRHYSNEKLLDTVRRCNDLGVKLTVFFMSGVGGDDRRAAKVELWHQIESQGRTSEVAVGAMILLDPGSRAFDEPAKHGYKLLCTTLAEHVEALSGPLWLQWYNYVAKGADVEDMAEMIFDDMMRVTEEELRCGKIQAMDVTNQRFELGLNRLLMRESKKTLSLKDAEMRHSRMWALVAAAYPGIFPGAPDTYGYRDLVSNLAASIYQGTKAPT